MGGRIVKFLLCLVFITSTAGYSTCQPAFHFSELIAMRDKNSACIAYSLSALGECLENMVEDLNKAISDLFGDALYFFRDTLHIVNEDFILKDAVNDSILNSRETGSAVFGDDYAFVQLFFRNKKSTLPHYNYDGVRYIFTVKHFCADRFGVYEYSCQDNPKMEMICTKSRKYKSIMKIDFPSTWGKRERINQCHPCKILQRGKIVPSWKNPAVDTENPTPEQSSQND
jgi:hypothetical protein